MVTPVLPMLVRSAEGSPADPADASSASVSSSSIARGIVGRPDPRRPYRVFWDADNVNVTVERWQAIERAMAPAQHLSIDLFAHGAAAAALVIGTRAADRPPGARLIVH